jgi:hypothetical protein
MRSRVMGLYAYNFQGVPAAGAMIMGFASQYLGLQVPAIGAGALALAATLWVWRQRASIAADMEITADAPPLKEAAE